MKMETNVWGSSFDSDEGLANFGEREKRRREKDVFVHWWLAGRGERVLCGDGEEIEKGRFIAEIFSGGCSLGEFRLEELCLVEAVTRWWYIRVGGAVSLLNSKAAKGENSSGSEGEMGEGRLKEMEKMN
ncbi:hypothetical protein HAX54_026486 [Datura stramonium]|uniref:Uncharacterized protein n=1 Tax=Datura stramonium TaxID=4076 RepID=A0ABS8V180_DATST|nr:hypothetical protein [Datura stramonium]